MGKPAPDFFLVAARRFLPDAPDPSSVRQDSLSCTYLMQTFYSISLYFSALCLMIRFCDSVKNFSTLNGLVRRQKRD